MRVERRGLGFHVRDLVRRGEFLTWESLFINAYRERSIDNLREIVDNSPLDWCMKLYPISGRETWHWQVAELYWQRAYPGHWKEMLWQLHGMEPRKQAVPLLEFPCSHT